MTPGMLRLFEGTVEPLLETVRAYLACRMDFYRDTKGTPEKLERIAAELEETRATLEREEAGTEGHIKAQWRVGAIGAKVHWVEEKGGGGPEATSELRAQLTAISERYSVPPLLRLGGPIVGRVGTSTSWQAPPACSPLQQQQDEQQLGRRAPWLITLVEHHPDPASTMLDFLGAGSALGGIGTASPALRATIKATLPRLSISMYYRDGSLPPLDTYPRLQHLAVHGPWHLDGGTERGEYFTDITMNSDLHTRLQSLCSNYWAPNYFKGLASKPWPQLRWLEVDRLTGFLDAVVAQRAAVFPRLQTLGTSELTGEDARKLLDLLQRGAFPSLTKLVPPMDSFYKGVSMASDTVEEAAQQLAVLERLSGTDSVRLHNHLGFESSLRSFAPTILGGCLSHLK
jgi:hypothetical protein